jgi:hypothetical protein
MVYTISIRVWITSIDAYKVIMPTLGGKQKDGIPIRVLSSMVSILEKLQEAKMQNAESNGITLC